MICPKCNEYSLHRVVGDGKAVCRKCGAVVTIEDLKPAPPRRFTLDPQKYCEMADDMITRHNGAMWGIMDAISKGE